MNSKDEAAKALPGSDADLLYQLQSSYETLRAEMGKIVIGQNEVIEQLLMAIFCRSHALLVGVPGLAKTLMVTTLGQALHLQARRIQFTPDLMPSDITGTEVIQDDPVSRQRVFKFMQGPIFSNIVLADEINRTPPKTQAALLEAMQERKVSIGGTDYPLPDPFFVLATQNPIEQEGTYALPEAQLDRFLFLIRVGYPTDAEEEQIMRLATSDSTPEISAQLDSETIIKLQHVIRRVPASDQIFQYAKRVVRLSRPGTPEAADFVDKYLTWGAGPRASLNLILAGKARAALQGRFHVTLKDIEKIAHPVLRHRLIPNFTAQSEGVTVDTIIDKLLTTAQQQKSKPSPSPTVAYE